MRSTQAKKLANERRLNGTIILPIRGPQSRKVGDSMKRGATIKLTDADKKAARKAVLDSRQGMMRDNGTL
jgi:hypothetical protein